MYYLSDFCCICLCNNKILQQLSTTDNDNITYLSKIISSVPEMSYNLMNDQRLLCKECSKNINTIYKFRQQCLRSKAIMIDYISQLRSVSLESGKISICLNNFQRQQDDVCIKSGNKIEGAFDSLCLVNVIKTELNERNFSDIDCHQMDYKNYLCFNYENFEENSHSGNKKSIDTQITADNVHIKSENKNELSDNPNLLNEINSEQNEVNSSVFDSQLTEELIIKTEDNEKDNEVYVMESNNGELESKNKTNKKPSTKYECTICKKTLTTPCGFRYHMRTHTGERPYTCTVCCKTFTQSSSLELHKKIHTGERPYKCETCDKTFIQLSSVRIHMRTHTGERPYTCTICSKTFNQPASLEQHKRTHTGERPYKCPTCDKTFSQANNLRYHMRTHTGDRPYACTICSKSFILSNRLEMHKRTHTRDRPYTCAICSKTLTLPGSIARHKRIHQENDLFNVMGVIKN